MSKITAEHLARTAYVYIRQSTADQLVHNLESQRRQYGLAERAGQLGWTSVEIIDDDLGRSGGGMRRPGFERLVAAICDGRVGAVLAIEVSRLARNGRDWHTLIEFCGLVGTIVFEHVGSATFFTSVFVCRTFGKIVTCGATSGFSLTFDVRSLDAPEDDHRLAFRQRVPGLSANQLIAERKILPVLSRTFPFEECADRTR